jgi:hypothetical protein
VATVAVGRGKKVPGSELEETNPSLRPVGTSHVILPPDICRQIIKTAKISNVGSQCEHYSEFQVWNIIEWSSIFRQSGSTP